MGVLSNKLRNCTHKGKVISFLPTFHTMAYVCFTNSIVSNLEAGQPISTSHYIFLQLMLLYCNITFDDKYLVIYFLFLSSSLSTEVILYISSPSSSYLLYSGVYLSLDYVSSSNIWNYQSSSTFRPCI